MTRGDLKRHVSLEFGLDLTTNSDEDKLMNDWAQDGIRDFLLKTNVRLVPTTITLTAGQGDYSMATLSANVMEIADLSYTSGGQAYYLERVSMKEILDYRRVTNVQDRARYYASEGDLFAVYPTPSANDTITAYAVIKPTAMTADADDLATTTIGGIPIQYHEVVLKYMLARAARYEGSRSVVKPPSEYAQDYLNALTDVRKQIRRQGGRTTTRMLVGYPGARRHAGAGNDIYPG